MRVPLRELLFDSPCYSENRKRKNITSNTCDTHSEYHVANRVLL